MIKFELREVTTPRKETVYLEHKCDICGVDSPWPGSDEWATDPYTIDDIEITRKKGYNYPGDGVDYEINEEVHICPECWVGVFIPWLATFGSKPSSVIGRYTWG